MGKNGLSSKFLMYEDSIRVPFFVYDPRLPESRRGTSIPEMVLTLDVAPTVLEYAGVPVPSEMDGAPLQRLILGDAEGWRTDWYYEFPPLYVSRGIIPALEGVRTSEWKYVRYTDWKDKKPGSPPYEQLFDLKGDPVEANNLLLQGDMSAQAREMLRQLRQRCDEYHKELHKPS
jgi:arylsulfatase A-like enzyme